MMKQVSGDLAPRVDVLLATSQLTKQTITTMITQANIKPIVFNGSKEFHVHLNNSASIIQLSQELTGPHENLPVKKDTKKRLNSQSSKKTGVKEKRRVTAMDYEEAFDPSSFLQTYYSAVNDKPQEWTIYVLGAMHELAQKGVFTGRLLDLGCGPTLHNTFSASATTAAVTFADICAKNRAEVRRWLMNKPGCFDWTPELQFVSVLEDHRRTPQEIAATVRRLATDVLYCDVTSSEIFSDFPDRHYDVIVSSLCLECACTTKDQYQRTLKNISKKIATGGTLVLVGVIGETYYDIDNTQFPVLSLKEEEVEDMLQKAGMEPFFRRKHVRTTGEEEAGKADNEGLFIVAARNI